MAEPRTSVLRGLKQATTILCPVSTHLLPPGLPAWLPLSLGGLLVSCFHHPLDARGYHRLPSSPGAPGAKTVASPRVPYVFIEGPLHYFSHTHKPCF